VRDLASGKPVRGALVYIERSAGEAVLASADRTNEAGHFAVFKAVERGRRTIPLLVVAEGFKLAEFPLPTLQSNPLIVRLAASDSPRSSRVEQMPAMPGDGNSPDGACASE
jgi:hypothetical protein